MSNLIQDQKLVLVSGATGYVGGRLVPRLIEAGYKVRVFVREARRLQGRPWTDEVEIIEGDVFKIETLTDAMRGVSSAYYLIHSMMETNDFHERDLLAARIFGQTAREQAIQRIIYLGGLGDPDAELSEHLRSRQRTGDALRESGIPVTEFRAAVIVGSGSISFEMVRYLTERLPVMICPSWVFTRIQPISIDNILDYLVEALITDASTGEIIEIGGADILTYAEMMLQYAQVRGLRRYLLPVPVLTPRLSSYWVHWMSPIPAEIARPLIEGLRNEVIVRDDQAKEIFPDINPVGYKPAVEIALSHLDASRIETTWSDALASSKGDGPSVMLKTQEGMIVEKRQLIIDENAQCVYRNFTSLGGGRGWLFMNWAWRIRGMIDRLFGGVGFRRGRRHPAEVRVGDALDFWRVEAVKQSEMLLLRGEMKVPGRAWLLFEVRSLGLHKSLLIQTAYFAPKGLVGILYWYVLYPIHALIFYGLVKQIGKTTATVLVREGVSDCRIANQRSMADL